MPRFRLRVVSILLPLLLGPPAAAETLRFAAETSAGTQSVWAGETVWNGNHRDSQLDWQSLGTAVASASVEALFPGGGRLRLSGTYGLGGDGHMVDYDWLADTSDWSDRSISPDTRLDELWSVALASEVPFADLRAGGWQARFTAGARGEFRRVKWTAYGGSYIYTTTPNVTFRDNVGTFTAGEKGISYQQSVPVAAVTLGAEARTGGLTFGLSGAAGVCFGIQDVDEHWLRDLRFYDAMGAAPAAGGSADLTADLGGPWSLTLRSDVLKVFPVKGSTTTITMSTGASGGTVAEAAGGDYLAVTLVLGIRAVF